MNSKILLALVVGLVAGALLGHLLAPGSSSSEGPTRIASTADDAGSSSVARFSDPSRVLAHDAATGDGDRAAVTERDARPAVVPTSAVDDAIARAPQAEIFEPRGDGVIEGRVVDVTGVGVAGVTIKVTGREPYSSLRTTTIRRRENSATVTLRELLDRTARSWAESRASTALATTDADGAFRVEGLDRSAEHTVRGYLDDHVVQGPPKTYGAGEAVELVAHGIVPVPILVVEPDGRPVDEAHLVIRSETGPELALWSVATETFEMLEGEVEVQAALDVHPNDWRFREIESISSACSEPTTVDVRPGLDRVVLRLTQADRLEVVLRPAAALPEDFTASVIVAPSGGGEIDLRNRQSKRVSAKDPAAHFGGLAAGPYDVRLEAGRRDGVLAHMVVEFRGGNQRAELAVPALVVRPPVRVRVLAPDGSGVEGARMTKFERRGRRTSGSGLHGEWQGDGWYETNLEPVLAIANGAERVEPADEVWFEVEHPAHGTSKVPLVEGLTEYVVAFAPAAAVNATITGWNLGEMRGAELELTPLDLDVDSRYSRGQRAQRLATDGTCRMEGVEPGRYAVAMLVAGKPWARSEVTLVAGENDVRLAIEPRFTVEVHAPGLEPGVQLALTPTSQDRSISYSSTHSAKIDDSHVAVFENVLGGRYELRSMFHTEQIDVPCGRITIDASMPNAIRISIYEEECLLADLGFEDGDLVVGVAGVAFDGIDALQVFLQTLGTEELVATVERDGSEVEVRTSSTAGRLTALQMDGGTIGFTTRD